MFFTHMAWHAVPLVDVKIKYCKGFTSEFTYFVRFRRQIKRFSAQLLELSRYWIRHEYITKFSPSSQRVLASYKSVRHCRCSHNESAYHNCTEEVYFCRSDVEACIFSSGENIRSEISRISMNDMGSKFAVYRSININ